MNVKVALSLMAALLLAVPASVRAQPDDEPSEAPEPQPEESDAATKAVARELGLAGIAAYKAGDHAEALDKLTRAHELVGLTTTGLWRARCLVALGRLVEGSEALFTVTRMALPEDAKPVHVEAQRKAAKERAELQPRIPRLSIVMVGEVPDDTVVTLDGRVVAPALLGVKQPVDPGRHVLEARGAGTSAEKKFTLEEGASLEVPIRLVDRDGTKVTPKPTAPKEADGTLATIGWIALGVGGAGLVVGGVTGGLALSKNGELESGCTDGDCPPPLHGDVDSFETLRLTSTVAFIAGGVIAATGISLLIAGALSDDTAASTELGVRVSPTGLSLWGSF